MNRYKAGACSMEFIGFCGSGIWSCISSAVEESCCTLQIKIWCCKSLVSVTASSAKQFLVAPVLSILFCDCTDENIFCNLKLKLNFEYYQLLLLPLQ